MPVHCLGETRQLLLGLRLFRGLSETDLTALLFHAELIECAANEVLIREGEQGHHLFVLLNGRVDIHKRALGRQKTIQTLGPGECFGEMSLIDCHSRSASVRAAAECKVIRVKGEEFEKSPEVASKIYRNIAIMLSQRLRSANDLLALG
jgi:CRP/FNR family cyclic AMP-dependent transcriptional regulator